MGPEPNVEVRDWGDFGVRRGNGPSYLLFRSEKVYELRTTIERDVEKLLWGFKVSRKGVEDLKPLVWDLFFIGGPLQDRNERVIRHLKRIREEPSEAARDNRIDEFRSCLHAAWKLWHQFVPKGPVTLRWDDQLRLEGLFDRDGEPSGFLDFSDVQRREEARETVLDEKDQLLTLRREVEAANP